MELSKQELAVLRAIKKNRFDDSRRAVINRLVTRFSVLLVLCIVVAVVSYQLEVPLLLLLAGVGAGVAVVWLWWLRSRVRLWPLWVQIIDWDEVDHLLAEADEGLPVPTLEVLRTDIRAAPDATGIQPPRPPRKEPLPDDD